jgi:hypothetical protein
MARRKLKIEAAGVRVDSAAPGPVETEMLNWLWNSVDWQLRSLGFGEIKNCCPCPKVIL